MSFSLERFQAQISFSLATMKEERRNRMGNWRQSVSRKKRSVWEDGKEMKWNAAWRLLQVCMLSQKNKIRQMICLKIIAYVFINIHHRCSFLGFVFNFTKCFLSKSKPCPSFSSREKRQDDIFFHLSPSSPFCEGKKPTIFFSESHFLIAEKSSLKRDSRRGNVSSHFFPAKYLFGLVISPAEVA